MATIVEGILLELEFRLPVVVDLIGTIEIHIEAIVVFIQVTTVLHRMVVFIVVVLDANKAIEFHLAGNAVLEIIDILRILVNLLLQRVDLARVLGGEFVEYGLVAKGAAAFLHGFGDDGGHLIARHGAATLEGTIPHTFNDALFGEVIECLVRPVVFRDIREAVSRRSEGRARHADRQASEDGKCFLVDFHVIDFLSL